MRHYPLHCEKRIRLSEFSSRSSFKMKWAAKALIPNSSPRGRRKIRGFGSCSTAQIVAGIQSN